MECCLREEREILIVLGRCSLVRRGREARISSDMYAVLDGDTSGVAAYKILIIPATYESSAPVVEERRNSEDVAGKRQPLLIPWHFVHTTRMMQLPFRLSCYLRGLRSSYSESTV